MAIPMVMMLLASQAAGLAANLWATNKANKLDSFGTLMQQRELDLQMQQQQLISTQESLVGLQRLTDIMSSQRAIFAARGQTPGGSNYFIGQNSIREYNADEEARKLSVGFKKYYLKASQNLMGLESVGRKGARNFDALSKGTNMMSFNSFGSGSSGGSGGGINDLLGGSSAGPNRK
jgi:hypothetical protein